MEIAALPTAVSRPLASQVIVGTDVLDPAEPAVSNDVNVSAPETLSDPLKDTDQEPSPDNAMVLAVASFVAVAAFPLIPRYFASNKVSELVIP